MAAAIKAATGHDVNVVEGNRGEFTIWVDDEVVARKDFNGFPTEADATAAVERALAGT